MNFAQAPRLIAGLANHFHIRLVLQQATQALAQENVIVS